MKTRVVRICAAMMFLSFGFTYTIKVGPQESINNNDKNTASLIRMHRIELSDNKTTNVIFPYAVKSIDRGSGDVIAQVVQGFGNVLQLKANVADFKQTNVTVITSDGKFYCFLVDYNSDPKELNISFVSDARQYENNDRQSIALSDDKENDAVLNADAANIQSAQAFLHKHTTNEQIKLRLSGIYLKDNLMWFKLHIGNHAQADFDIDNLSFSIVDKKQIKRTARQEILLQPVYVKSLQSIKGQATKELVLAFKQFTLSNTKRLKIQVSDKSGDRNLILYLKREKLLRARLLKA